jgi:hypothetical protein
MFYIIVTIILFLSLLSISFARDSFLNRELAAYQRQIDEPWLDRLTILKWSA